MPWEKSDADATPSEPAAASLSDPGVLALAKGQPITRALYTRRLEALPEDHASGFLTTFGSVRIIHRKPRSAEEKKIFLEELVKEELLVQYAV